MAAPIDPKNGFCAATGVFHSLRPPLNLPPSSEPLSVSSFIFSSLSSNPPPPSKPAIVNASEVNASISYAELFSHVHNLASNLRSTLGLSKGDVAFVLSPASLDVPVLYLALLTAGVIITPSNPASTPEEISRQFDLVRPAITFSTPEESRKLPPAARTILLGSTRFRSLLSSNNTKSKSTSAPVYQSDTAACLFTSGTTGRVKAAVLSHLNFVAILAEEREDENTPHVSFFTVPLFHVFGLTMLLRVMAAGDTMVFLEKLDFVSMFRAVERHRVTTMPVSPPLVVAMVKSDLAERFDLSSMKNVGCGGAPLGREVAERFVKRFPHIEIIQGYGLTESTGPAASTVGPEERMVYGSTGRIGYNLEARIVDPSSGQSLPPGQRGELWLRGPTVMKGYLGDDEATVSTITSDGWLKTGDLCYFDENGFLFIVDRLKELIKYKAYQVPPAELERILLSHPQIADAAVIPYPDEEAGEIPMAYVVRKPSDNISAEEVMNFVAKKVAPYKKIRRVAFIEAIPKSPAGKIQRRQLVELARSAPISKL